MCIAPLTAWFLATHSLRLLAFFVVDTSFVERWARPVSTWGREPGSLPVFLGGEPWVHNEVLDDSWSSTGSHFLKVLGHRQATSTCV